MYGQHRYRCEHRNGMTRTALNGLSWFCLSLQLLAAALTFGRVLCVASDGHVAFELAHAGACQAEARRHGSDEHAGVRTNSDHPCTDIALSQPILQLYSRSCNLVPPQLALIPARAVFPARLLAHRRPNTVQVSPFAYAVRARRPIVLLV